MTADTNEEEPLLTAEADDIEDRASGGYGTVSSKTTAASDVDQDDQRRGPDSDVDPEIAEARNRIKLIFFSLSFGVLLGSLDGAIVNTNYATISAEFQSLHLAPWISTSFFLALTVVQPLFGKMSDIFGRKSCLLVAYGIVAIGSLLCGLARTMGQFIAARGSSPCVIQGCGAGGTGILTTIIISDIVTIRDRGIWQSYINLLVTAGSSLGAPVGGFCAETIGWRWTFLGQVPFLLLTIPCVYFLLKLPSTPSSGVFNRLKRIDLLGGIFLTGAIVSILLGTDRGSNVSFRAPQASIPLALFPIFAILFFLNEGKFATDPILPGRAMVNRSVLAVYATNFLAYASFSSLLFYIPLFYQALDSATPTQAGVRLLPITIGATSGALVAGQILKRTGRYYGLMVISHGGAALATLLVVAGTWFTQHDIVFITAGSFLASFLFGVGLTGSLIALITNIDRKDQAVTTGFMFLLRYLGSAIAISVNGTILQSLLRHKLTSALHGRADVDVIINGVSESLSYIDGLDSRVQVIVRSSYGAAIRVGFIVDATLLLGACLCCVCIRGRKMDN